MIRDSVGPEVARIALSLLPDEPIESGPSLESDILLGKIKSLANQPANRDEIARRRSMRESVTSRLLLEGKNLDIVTFPARDSRGLTRLDYAIRLHSPSDLTLTEENGRYTYSVEVRVVVYTADNKLILRSRRLCAIHWIRRAWSGLKKKFTDMKAACLSRRANTIWTFSLRIGRKKPPIVLLATCRFPASAKMASWCRPCWLFHRRKTRIRRFRT